MGVNAEHDNPFTKETFCYDEATVVCLRDNTPTERADFFTVKDIERDKGHLDNAIVLQ